MELQKNTLLCNIYLFIGIIISQVSLAGKLKIIIAYISRLTMTQVSQDTLLTDPYFENKFRRFLNCHFYSTNHSYL
jgi:hypothetical protein